MSGSREGADTPGKSQIAICSLRNAGMDPLEKLLDPLVQLFLEAGPYSPLLNTLMTKKIKTPLIDFLDPPMYPLMYGIRASDYVSIYLG